MCIYMYISGRPRALQRTLNKKVLTRTPIRLRWVEADSVSVSEPEYVTTRLLHLSSAFGVNPYPVSLCTFSTTVG